MSLISTTLKAFLLVVVLTLCQGQHDPNFVGNRTTMVHLFEWRWDDIAEECERFLGPYGYGGVQVSPANENVVIFTDGLKRPWYERYQPVSYKLETRSGTEAQFQSMVRRCNNVGVRIYVDLVLNHMTTQEWGSGHGTGGSFFDSVALNYDGVPYTSPDFHQPSDCPTSSGDIEDFQDPVQMRNCKLLKLNDLHQGKEHVRERMAEFMNRLISYGVAGFRIDAARHMWPEDLGAIYARLNSLPTDHGFPAGAKPFVMHEIIVLGGDEDAMIPYFPMGRVTEFKAGVYFGDLFRQWQGQQLRYLRNWGEPWGFISDNNALVFVDNHDNQRGHGAGGEGILTYKVPRLYKMATAFNLAWPYGLSRIMSSYAFEDGNIGPPVDANWNTLPVTINPDMTCGNGWICEHRWQQIYRMVGFRNAVKGTNVNDWYDGGEAGPNQIAFSRGAKGFIAFNNDNHNFVASVTTFMPDGEYCDIMTSKPGEPSCTGRVVRVFNGQVSVNIPGGSEDPVIAIHV